MALSGIYCCAVLASVLPVLLVHSAEHFSYSSKAPPCPVNCTCVPPSGGSIEIRCQNWLEDAQLLDKQINDYIRGVASTANVTSLLISDSILNAIPATACELMGLKDLNLDNNRIAELPDDCFSRMPQLSSLTMERNFLTRLQDGLFDGLQKLESVSFARNQINDVGLNLFSNYSDLPKLRNIVLNKNQLSVLEPWPFIRAQVYNGSTINLDDNLITNFTNNIGWHFNCSTPRFLMSLFMRKNRIVHITDLLRAYGLDSFQAMFCLYGSNPYSRMWIALDDGHSFTCDCIDFTIYSIVKGFQAITVLDRTICNLPGELYGQKIVSVPLDAFICRVTDKCPAGCRCFKQPSNGTFHVLCDHTGMIALPDELPPSDLPMPIHAKYKLDFSSNDISQFDHRPYLANTKWLDVSHSNVVNITDDAWMTFLNMSSQIHLANNWLTSLPAVANGTHPDDYRFEALSVHENPFRCACGDQWQKYLLVAFGSRLMPGAVTCDAPLWNRGKNMLNLTDDDFCHEPRNKVLDALLQVVLPTLSATLLACMFGFFLVYKCRVSVYTRFKLHLFNRDECEGEDMEYDVFVCCAGADDALARELIQRLEDERFKVCFHRRDFIGGRPILDGIGDAIVHSKRTLCLVTPHFLRSDYCMLEFRSAMDAYIERKKHRLIVVKYANLDEEAWAYRGAAEMRVFVAAHTYVDATEEGWIDQLLYSLPVQRMGAPTATNDDDVGLLQ